RLLADLREPSDYLITVCDNAHEELGALDALHWSVPDPVRVGDPAAFEAAFADLARRVGELAPRVVAA
ncbi:MAG: ArsR family transcriptional regulator, partial [Pseudolysinimonas sp.]